MKTESRKKKHGCFEVGVDEAGYGPRLGPLCSAAAWVRLDKRSELDGAAACDIAGSALMDDYGLLIADSKTIFHSPADIAKLWLPVAAIIGAFSDPPAPPKDTTALLDLLCPPEDIKKMRACKWYLAGEDYHVSGLGEGLKLNATAQRIREKLSAAGVLDFGVRVRVVPSPNFNRLVDELGNKAELNWALTASHFKFCRDKTTRKEALRFFCDRHGGRVYYAEKLTDSFDGFVWADEENLDASRYRIERPGREIQVEFYTGGEQRHSLVALAGMAAKLARELWMKRFNHFFRLHALPEELKPTSGYSNDSGRFLKQVERIIRDHGFKLEELVRKV